MLGRVEKGSLLIFNRTESRVETHMKIRLGFTIEGKEVDSFAGDLEQSGLYMIRTDNGITLVRG